MFLTKKNLLSELSYLIYHLEYFENILCINMNLI